MPALPWNAIDTVLLDMDGTLLDLHFDNHFWLQHLPQRYAEHHGVSRALAEAELLPLFREHAGTLNWYCTDFWSRELNLSIRDLKREVAHLIALRPDADTFIQALRQAGTHRTGALLRPADQLPRLWLPQGRPAVLARPAARHQLHTGAQPVYR